jgi:hypothetical protein
MNDFSLIQTKRYQDNGVKRLHSSAFCDRNSSFARLNFGSQLSTVLPSKVSVRKLGLLLLIAEYSGSEEEASCSSK